MTEDLTTNGYEQTRKKLQNLERRLAEIEARTDLAPSHRARVIRSYNTMMGQYLREIKLYESRHSISTN